jgi:hypothetical protein
MSLDALKGLRQGNETPIIGKDQVTLFVVVVCPP